MEVEDADYPPPFGIGVTRHGRCIRFSLKAQAETTNKSGRRYLKSQPSSKKGPIEDAVIAVYPVSGAEHVSLLTAKNRGLSFPVAQITLVRGPGKGVYAMKLEKRRPHLWFRDQLYSDNWNHHANTTWKRALYFTKALWWESGSQRTGAAQKRSASNLGAATDAPRYLLRHRGSRAHFGSK